MEIIHITPEQMEFIVSEVDKRLESLVIDGLDDDKYFIESVSSIFPKGNYHIQELNLYFINIQDNLRERVNGIVSATCR